MNPAYEPLFTPFSIRNTRIKNRYFMAAMGTVTHNDEDGAYLPDAVDYFVRRAAGGVGLIITGANWVDNNIEVHSPGSFPCPTICPQCRLPNGLPRCAEPQSQAAGRCPCRSLSCVHGA